MYTCMYDLQGPAGNSQWGIAIREYLYIYIYASLIIYVYTAWVSYINYIALAMYSLWG